MSNCLPTSWMLFKEPLSMTQSTVPCTRSPLASPKDHPTLLGHLEQAVHRGWYSPEGRSCLHPSGTTGLNPYWPPQYSPGGWKNTGPSPRSSLLARDRHWHHQLHQEMFHLHSAQGLPTSSTDIPQRHPQQPVAGKSDRYFNHSGKGYLLIADLFSKYPFLFHITAGHPRS